jgi:hypothetical protein
MAIKTVQEHVNEMTRMYGMWEHCTAGMENTTSHRFCHFLYNR